MMSEECKLIDYISGVEIMSAVLVQPFLEVRGITKKYGNGEALKGVDLKVYTGEVLAIVGDNGAGKSTIIKILSGAIAPDSGEIIIVLF